MKSLFPINRTWHPLSSAKSSEKEIAVLVYVCQMFSDSAVLVILILRKIWIWDFERIIPSGGEWSARSKRPSSVVLSATKFHMGWSGFWHGSTRWQAGVLPSDTLHSFSLRLKYVLYIYNCSVSEPQGTHSGSVRKKCWWMFSEERNSDYRADHKKHISTVSDKMQRSSKVKVGGV